MSDFLFQLLIFSLAVNYITSESACLCVDSNSTYLTTVPSPATTAPITFSGIAQDSVCPKSTAKLSSVTTGASFSKSSSGFTYNSANDFFTIPANTTEPMIVVDLLVGLKCHRMPYIEQICVSSNCNGCNLNMFSVAATDNLTGSAAFSKPIIYPTSIINTTVIADRAEFERLGAFRYIVFLAQRSPYPSQPYGFRIGISGNFSAYNCIWRGRRSTTDNVDASAEATVLNDCSCPVGQDPVFASTMTVFISWVYLDRPFHSVLSNKSSSEYMTLARESYYLLMNAVRNSTLSKLASVVADFFDIEFSSDSGGKYTKMNGKLRIRNDTACRESCSSSFLLRQLRARLPESRITSLNVTSPLDIFSPTPSNLPVFLIVIIALAVIVFNIALSVGLGVVMCRLKKNIKNAMAGRKTPDCGKDDQVLDIPPAASDDYNYMVPDVVPAHDADQDTYDYI